jgi:hypothetical protein
LAFAATLCPHPASSPPLPRNKPTPIPLPKTSFLANDEMADQSGSPQTPFESALRAYEEKTGVTLAQHPLAQQVQSCQSTHDITTLLQGQVQAFDESRRDKIIRSIKATVSILTPLSAAASLPDAFGLVRLEALWHCFASVTTFCRHLRRQFRLASLSYLMYVLLFSSYLHVLMMFKQTRRPTASYPVSTRSSTCSNRSNNSSAVSIYIRRSLLRPQ